MATARSKIKEKRVVLEKTRPVSLGACTSKKEPEAKAAEEARAQLAAEAQIKTS